MCVVFAGFEKTVLTVVGGAYRAGLFHNGLKLSEDRAGAFKYWWLVLPMSGMVPLVWGTTYHPHHAFKPECPLSEDYRFCPDFFNAKTSEGNALMSRNLTNQMQIFANGFCGA